MMRHLSGLTTAEWDKELQFNPPNRRQARTTIRKLMGGEDPIREDSRASLSPTSTATGRNSSAWPARSHPGQYRRPHGGGQLSSAAPRSKTSLPATTAGGPPSCCVTNSSTAARGVHATELARRQHAAGATTLAYETARLGIRVYPQREDLWEIALACAADSERPGLLYDLKQAIPAPRTPELRQLYAEARTR